MNKTDFIIDHASELKSAVSKLQGLKQKLTDAPDYFFDRWESDTKAGKDPLSSEYDDGIVTLVSEAANSESEITADTVLNATLVEGFGALRLETIICAIDDFTRYVNRYTH